MLRCDNCGRKYAHQGQLPHVFPEIPGLLSRLDPGGTVPVGECPECGALVYPEAEPQRILLLVERGRVQAVWADRPELQAAVLDMDVDGADEEKIIEVAAEADTLRGTLQVLEVTVAPRLIAAAWRTGT